MMGAHLTLTLTLTLSQSLSLTLALALTLTVTRHGHVLPPRHRRRPAAARGHVRHVCIYDSYAHGDDLPPPVAMCAYAYTYTCAPRLLTTRLQPYPREAATLSTRGCNPIHERLRPCAQEAATLLPHAHACALGASWRWSLRRRGRRARPRAARRP